MEVSRIFVFGSNLAGRHGLGAAKCALKEHGAVYGRGEGRQGSSYAIPTKDEKLRVRPLREIALSIQRFIRYTEANPDLTFELTPVGCGLAGYKASEIAPLFMGCPRNVELSSYCQEEIWKDIWK